MDVGSFGSAIPLLTKRSPVHNNIPDTNNLKEHKTTIYRLVYKVYTRIDPSRQCAIFGGFFLFFFFVLFG